MGVGVAAPGGERRVGGVEGAGLGEGAHLEAAGDVEPGLDGEVGVLRPEGVGAEAFGGGADDGGGAAQPQEVGLGLEARPEAILPHRDPLLGDGRAHEGEGHGGEGKRLAERQGEFERLLSVKTAQVRLSVRIVCLLPAAMLLILALVSPDFQQGLLTPAGVGCVTLAVALDLAALLIIRRMVRGVL